MKIILTGASGLIGNRFEELMFENHEIIPLSSSQGVDITDKESIKTFLDNKEFDVMIHLAGKTDVDSCELDKEVDMELLKATENSLLDLNISSIESDVFTYKKTAVAINTFGTKNLYDVCVDKGKKFVYISSDFVFSGKEEFSNEQSTPDPVDWYGMSKYLGEKIIDINLNLIVRLSFPYGFQSMVKKDFVWKLHDLLRDKEEVSLVSDQTITPTFIDDIVNGLDFLLNKNATGIYHLNGSNSLTPLHIGEKIKEAFGFKTLINATNLETLYSGKAPRPFQSIMKNGKLVALGYTPKTFDEGLALISSK